MANEEYLAIVIHDGQDVIDGGLAGEPMGSAITMVREDKEDKSILVAEVLFDKEGRSDSFIPLDTSLLDEDKHMRYKEKDETLTEYQARVLQEIVKIYT